ncbi:MAG: hypothetical protein BJG00_010710 [Limnothrix sp. CACIAM 69d]|nr:MAG: hypothetical protein BJG00_010710 [Limnothrix sp. CACIAM 69d]
MLTEISPCLGVTCEGAIGQGRFDPTWKLLIRLKQLLEIAKEKRQRMVNAPHVGVGILWLLISIG